MDRLSQSAIGFLLLLDHLLHHRADVEDLGLPSHSPGLDHLWADHVLVRLRTNVVPWSVRNSSQEQAVDRRL